MPITIRHGWRTRVREFVATFVACASGVVAATAGAPIALRLIGAVLFVVGTYAVLDAVVLGSSWRLTDEGLKVPSLVNRQRVIPDADDLVVTPAGRWVGLLVVRGERGVRSLTANPLVSPHDLRGWFATIAVR